MISDNIEYIKYLTYNIYSIIYNISNNISIYYIYIYIYIINYINNIHNLRELGLANRRKYRMSCVHACVGSFGVITRVCQMGGEGHLVHLASPCPTEPQNRYPGKQGCGRRYPPFLVELLVWL